VSSNLLFTNKIKDFFKHDVSLQTNLDTKQDIITDDILLTSYTAGLQAALNNLTNNDVSLQTNIETKQDIIAVKKYLIDKF
jgi:hypothetical protein